MDINTLLEVRHSFGIARLELMLASEKLAQTGMFRDTRADIDDTVADLTKAVEHINLHLKD